MKFTIVTLLGVVCTLVFGLPMDPHTVNPVAVAAPENVGNIDSIANDAENSINAKGSMSPAVDAPAPAPVSTRPAPPSAGPPPLTHPTGEAVTTETRTPDGSVITVTKFNGQLPHSMFQPQFPGFWGPFQYGIPRPFYQYPI